MRNYYIFIVFLGIVILTVIILGLSMVGSPFLQRDKSFDSTRLSDFTNIKYGIENYVTNNNKLPNKLTDLKSNVTMKDPRTGKAYDYEVLNNSNYKLCTEFSTDSSEMNNEENTYTPSYSDQQKHKKGYDCIVYTLSDYLVGRYISYPTPTPEPTIRPNCLVPSDPEAWCSNHGGIAMTINYDIPKGDWLSCLSWCDRYMNNADLPLCQYNFDGPRNCWINHAPGYQSGITNGDVTKCIWQTTHPPKGSLYAGYNCSATATTIPKQ